MSGARVLLITAPKWDALCDKRADATEIGLLKPFRVRSVIIILCHVRIAKFQNITLAQ